MKGGLTALESFDDGESLAATNLCIKEANFTRHNVNLQGKVETFITNKDEDFYWEVISMAGWKYSDNQDGSYTLTYVESEATSNTALFSIKGLSFTQGTWESDTFLSDADTDSILSTAISVSGSTVTISDASATDISITECNGNYTFDLSTCSVLQTLELSSELRGTTIITNYCQGGTIKLTGSGWTSSKINAVTDGSSSTTEVHLGDHIILQDSGFESLADLKSSSLSVDSYTNITLEITNSGSNTSSGSLFAYLLSDDLSGLKIWRATDDSDTAYYGEGDSDTADIVASGLSNLLNSANSLIYDADASAAIFGKLGLNGNIFSLYEALGGDYSLQSTDTDVTVTVVDGYTVKPSTNSAHYSDGYWTVASSAESATYTAPKNDTGASMTTANGTDGKTIYTFTPTTSTNIAPTFEFTGFDTENEQGSLTKEMLDACTTTLEYDSTVVIGKSTNAGAWILTVNLAGDILTAIQKSASGVTLGKATGDTTSEKVSINVTGLSPIGSKQDQPYYVYDGTTLTYKTAGASKGYSLDTGTTNSTKITYSEDDTATDVWILKNVTSTTSVHILTTTNEYTVASTIDFTGYQFTPEIDGASSSTPFDVGTDQIEITLGNPRYNIPPADGSTSTEDTTYEFKFEESTSVLVSADKVKVAAGKVEVASNLTNVEVVFTGCATPQLKMNSGANVTVDNGGTPTIIIPANQSDDMTITLSEDIINGGKIIFEDAADTSKTVKNVADTTNNNSTFTINNLKVIVNNPSASSDYLKWDVLFGATADSEGNYTSSDQTTLANVVLDGAWTLDVTSATYNIGGSNVITINNLPVDSDAATINDFTVSETSVTIGANLTSGEVQAAIGIYNSSKYSFKLAGEVNTSIEAHSDNTTIYGGGGSESITTSNSSGAYPKNVLLSGGAGSDYLKFSGGEGVTLSGGLNAAGTAVDDDADVFFIAPQSAGGDTQTVVTLADVGKNDKIYVANMEIGTGTAVLNLSEGTVTFYDSAESPTNSIVIKFASTLSSETTSAQVWADISDSVIVTAETTTDGTGQISGGVPLSVATYEPIGFSWTDLETDETTAQYSSRLTVKYAVGGTAYTVATLYNLPTNISDTDTLSTYITYEFLDADGNVLSDPEDLTTIAGIVLKVKGDAVTSATDESMSLGVNIGSSPYIESSNVTVAWGEMPEASTFGAHYTSPTWAVDSVSGTETGAATLYSAGYLTGYVMETNDETNVTLYNLMTLPGEEATALVRLAGISSEAGAAEALKAVTPIEGDDGYTTVTLPNAIISNKPIEVSAGTMYNVIFTGNSDTKTGASIVADLGASTDNKVTATDYNDNITVRGTMDEMGSVMTAIVASQIEIIGGKGDDNFTISDVTVDQTGSLHIDATEGNDTIDFAGSIIIGVSVSSDEEDSDTFKFGKDMTGSAKISGLSEGDKIIVDEGTDFSIAGEENAKTLKVGSGFEITIENINTAEKMKAQLSNVAVAYSEDEDATTTTLGEIFSQLSWVNNGTSLSYQDKFGVEYIKISGGLTGLTRIDQTTNQETNINITSDVVRLETVSGDTPTYYVVLNADYVSSDVTTTNAVKMTFANEATGDNITYSVDNTTFSGSNVVSAGNWAIGEDNAVTFTSAANSGGFTIAKGSDVEIQEKITANNPWNFTISGLKGTISSETSTDANATIENYVKGITLTQGTGAESNTYTLKFDDQALDSDIAEVSIGDITQDGENVSTFTINLTLDTDTADVKVTESKESTEDTPYFNLDSAYDETAAQSSTSLTYYFGAGIINEGYYVDNNSIKYREETLPSDISKFTITGLNASLTNENGAAIDGITVNENEVTLTDAVLNSGTATFTATNDSGFKLIFTNTSTATENWAAGAVAGAFNFGEEYTAGYTSETATGSTKIIYHPEGDRFNYFTISGLISSVTANNFTSSLFSEDNASYTIKLDSTLINSDSTLVELNLDENFDGSAQLELVSEGDNKVDLSTTSGKGWMADSDTDAVATYHTGGSTPGFKLEGTHKVEYLSTNVADTTPITLKGLNVTKTSTSDTITAAITLNEDDNSVTIGKEVLGANAALEINGADYMFKFGDEATVSSITVSSTNTSVTGTAADETFNLGITEINSGTILIDGGAGKDTFEISNATVSGEGSVKLRGGEDEDTFKITDSENLELVGGAADADTVSDIFNISGSKGISIISGANDSDVFKFATAGTSSISIKGLDKSDNISLDAAFDNIEISMDSALKFSKSAKMLPFLSTAQPIYASCTPTACTIYKLPIHQMKLRVWEVC